MGTRNNTTPEDWSSQTKESNTPSLLEVTAPTNTGTLDNPKEKTLAFGEYSLSIDEVYRDIKRLTLSKNPLDLIFKANEIREKFAFFINSLASFISESFSSFENDSFINELYHDSGYHYVWMELALPFLEDARFCCERFDHVTYEYKNNDGTTTLQDVDIDALIKRSKKESMNNEDFFAVKALIQIIIDDYRGYKNVERRRGQQNLIRKIDTEFQPVRIDNLSKTRREKAQKKVDDLLADFPYIKEHFRTDLEAVFETYELTRQDREDMRISVFKEIIDFYYPDIRCIFFDSSLPFGKKEDGGKQLLTKSEWLHLKGMQGLDIKSIGTGKDEEFYKDKNQEYFRHVLNCKALILDLERSILSPILLPIILKIVASAMTLDRGEFYKFSYILLFLFANSYENEYVPLSRFLYELEVYINFNNTPRGIEKFKIGFSLLVLFALFVGLGYFLLPPLVFIPGIILTGIYIKMYFVDDYTYSAGIQYNLGIRLWST
ncbi:MAG: hypothetical protein Q8K26_01405, partial [Candidatus Gracilibacteria bacterium]|nr:hypothetical protein [Candidatus Gracilibacteria bacterium]